jgi:hypothetical protein
MAVQLCEPTFLVGFIQFTIPGGRECLAGQAGADKDENTITFKSKDQMPDAQKVHDLILELKRKAKEPPSSSGPNDSTRKASHGPPASVADELRKLKTLMDEGVLTPEEFEIQKQKLLGQ